MPRSALPNLIIIGAQKCGTTSLHEYLDLHPAVSMSRVKELNYFVESRNWPRGVDWYKSHFDADAAVRGESSPHYSAYPYFRGVPERMHELVPGARLIFMVRDPLERIAAHWVHNFARRRDYSDLTEALADPHTTYVPRSMYFMQISRFLAYYPRARILIVEQEKLRDKRAGALRRIFEFIGVDPAFSDPAFARVMHKSSRKRRASRVSLWLERQSRTDVGRFLPPPGAWFALEARIPFRRAIPRPDVRSALGPNALRLLREDAERLREFADEPFESWSIWSD